MTCSLNKHIVFFLLNMPPLFFSLCRRSKKHPSVPGAKQDEGLLLHSQPGPRGSLQDQDCGEVTLVQAHLSIFTSVFLTLLLNFLVYSYRNMQLRHLNNT